MSHYEIIIVSLVFFAIALCYSSAGFGGGSSYLAILALVGLAVPILRPTALLCNIVVVSSSTWLHSRAGHISWKKSLPLIMVSIPMAFIGGYFPISDQIFFIILAIALLVSSILLWVQPTNDPTRQSDQSINFTVIIGAGIGFLAGIVSIGGGIFLSPVLHFSRWNSVKKITAITSLFILVNSVAGLFGQMAQYDFQLPWSIALSFMFSVFLGGQIGSRLSINILKPILIKRITAMLILLVSMRILFDQFFS